ncbi:MAG: nucleotide exchange factor GrpE [Trueperaceae bacterium]|nr:nucleotide exchange factor GrpE [Trueperaceae bacterium]
MRTDQDERTSTAGWEQASSDRESQETTPAGAQDTEADILRTELRRVREKTAALEQELVEAKDRALRYRAEMETMRRRQQGELQQARDQGKDETIMPVLAVYDDLERALAAAASTEDEGGIVAGVKLVKENLERQLAHLGIRRTGTVGEEFDPQVHEALSTVPSGPGRTPGTIFQVFEPGFLQGDRLIRVARVVVVADSDAN